jgi:hypothetical protein
MAGSKPVTVTVQVVDATQVGHDGVAYAAGEQLTLPEEVAARYERVGLGSRDRPDPASPVTTTAVGIRSRARGTASRNRARSDTSA